jgi:hypothetical protein
MWIINAFGAKLHKKLPITLDSLRTIELTGERYMYGEVSFIAKPKGRWPLRQRIRHAWYVLTAQAFAVQFTEDHIRLARKNGTKI